MRIPYQLHRGYFLPLCEVVILGTRSNAAIKAVIDTGAVRSIFPSQPHGMLACLQNRVNLKA